MGVYHSCQLEIDNKWTIQKTADFFKVSLGLASENLRLAELFLDYPDLQKEDTRREALAKIDRRKFPRMRGNG